MGNNPSAAWPLSSLLRSYKRAGWLGLAGRKYSAARTVLEGLVTLLPDLSAKGKITHWQIADCMGVSVRTVQRGIALLEPTGLIIHNRGLVLHGRPLPGWFKVRKGTLARWIRQGRKCKPARELKRDMAFQERKQTFRAPIIQPYKWEKSVSRVDLKPTLHHLKVSHSVTDSPGASAEVGKSERAGRARSLSEKGTVMGDTPTWAIRGEPVEPECSRPKRRVKREVLPVYYKRYVPELVTRDPEPLPAFQGIDDDVPDGFADVWAATGADGFIGGKRVREALRRYREGKR